MQRHYDKLRKLEAPCAARGASSRYADFSAHIHFFFFLSSFRFIRQEKKRKTVVYQNKQQQQRRKQKWEHQIGRERALRVRRYSNISRKGSSSSSKSAADNMQMEVEQSAVMNRFLSGMAVTEYLDTTNQIQSACALNFPFLFSFFLFLFSHYFLSFFPASFWQ